MVAGQPGGSERAPLHVKPQWTLLTVTHSHRMLCCFVSLQQYGNQSESNKLFFLAWRTGLLETRGGRATFAMRTRPSRFCPRSLHTATLRVTEKNNARLYIASIARCYASGGLCRSSAWVARLDTPHEAD